MFQALAIADEQDGQHKLSLAALEKAFTVSESRRRQPRTRCC